MRLARKYPGAGDGGTPGRGGSCCSPTVPKRCGGTEAPESRPQSVAPWTDGSVRTPAGEIPRVRMALSSADRYGSFKARWGIGRMDYRVAPGLYAAGNPDAGSPVLVSANYKMSFDRLRDVLPKRSAWILVLDTNGINVWCAAGEGTFGTEEIVRRVSETGLERIVSHRTLVVPQLGAPGVSAHEVRARCGFRVEYGPVRAEDLPAFLDGGGKASAEMRRVRFDARDRAVLIPVELVGEGKHALLLAAAFALAGGFGPSGYSLAGVRTAGLGASAVVLGSFVGAAVLGPLLLPWLPGRAFSVKGAVLGLLFSAGLAVAGAPGPADSWLGPIPWALIVPALSSFVVMLFTGATTFTSLSGVLREMRFAVPLQIAGVVAGFGLWVAGRFVGGGIPG